MRKLIVLLVILAVAYGGGEVAARNLAESRIEQEGRARVPPTSEVDARVSFPLLLGLLVRSEVAEVEVSVRNVSVGPFLSDRVSAAIERVRVDRAASISRRELVIEAIGVLRMSVELTQEQISEILPSGLSFEISPDSVILRHPAGEVRGTFELAPPAGVRFVAEGAVLPGGLAAPGWSFEDVPFVTCFERVEFAPGGIRITCAVENPPARFPPE